MATCATVNFAPMFKHQQKQPRKNWKRQLSVQKSMRRHFRSFGGNQYDPLNLNEVNEISNQITNYNSGNNRLVEILVPPNIHDPLCLASSPSDHLVPFSNETHSSQPENDRNSRNYQSDNDWFLSPYSPWNFNNGYCHQRLIFTDVQPITDP